MYPAALPVWGFPIWRRFETMSFPVSTQRVKIRTRWVLWTLVVATRAFFR